MKNTFKKYVLYRQIIAFIEANGKKDEDSFVIKFPEREYRYTKNLGFLISSNVTETIFAMSFKVKIMKHDYTNTPCAMARLESEMNYLLHNINDYFVRG